MCFIANIPTFQGWEARNAITISMEFRNMLWCFRYEADVIIASYQGIAEPAKKSHNKFARFLDSQM
jgi:hypothetical protein